MLTKILVVGGAGYIGSHMVRCLQAQGFTPVVLDNLVTGHRDALNDAELVEADMADAAVLDKLFQQHQFAAVMHFGAFIQVGESVQNPAKYYQNNVAATLQLLQAMLKWQVKNFIFSSTAAVYGEPQYTPIDEKHPLLPINPYGQSKRMVEIILEDLARANDFNYAVLRYFNAAGADPDGNLAERHEPETHLIPLILQVANGQRPDITVFGRDYDTPDGTCVRDYVHVSDLCDAHLLAMKKLFNGVKSCIYNLGTGKGFSVQEVIATAQEVTGKNIAIVEGKRRAGDPAILVADPARAINELNWHPRYTDLKTIIQHAWQSIK